MARGNRERDDARELLGRATTHGDIISAVARLRIADSLFAQARAEDSRWTRPLVERGWTALVRASVDSGESRKGLFAAALAFARQATAEVPNDATALELRGTARWRAYRAGG
ncbi:MAG: hypothetical protein ACRDMZ_23955, partial [Solirubrobacteraceae bacterium]